MYSTLRMLPLIAYISIFQRKTNITQKMFPSSVQSNCSTKILACCISQNESFIFRNCLPMQSVATNFLNFPELALQSYILFLLTQKFYCDQTHLHFCLQLKTVNLKKHSLSLIKIGCLFNCFIGRDGELECSPYKFIHSLRRICSLA